MLKFWYTFAFFATRLLAGASPCLDLPVGCECTIGDIKVECSGKHLKALPNNLPTAVTELVVQDTSIRRIGSELNHLRNLARCQITDSLIEWIHPMAFRNKANLSEIELQNNQIKALDNVYFTDITGLGRLRLNNNNISSIHHSAFGSLRRVGYLVLDHNLLTEFPTQSLSKLEYIAQLDVSHNNIKELKSKFLKTQIETLSLVQCQLSRIHNDAFNSLGTKFAELDLKENALTSVPNISVLLNLKTLRLNHNRIRYVESGTFEGLQNLRHVDLHNNDNLTHVNANAFRNLPALKAITLSSCNISYLHPEAIKNTPQLDTVALDYNELETIPQEFVQWHRMQTLFLFDNPWNCNCSLRFLHYVSQYTHVIFHHMPKCFYPVELRDQPIDEVSSRRFVCPTTPAPPTTPTKASTTTESIGSGMASPAIAMVSSILTVLVVATALTAIIWKFCMKRKDAGKGKTETIIKETPTRKISAISLHSMQTGVDFQGLNNPVYVNNESSCKYIRNDLPSVEVPYVGETKLGPSEKKPLKVRKISTFW